MRVPHSKKLSSPKNRQTALRAVALSALCAAAAAGATASAQQSPGSFTLPQPTPTPTPAPQGPVDVRNGVVIGPRTIPNRPAESTQEGAAQPAQAETTPALEPQTPPVDAQAEAAPVEGQPASEPASPRPSNPAPSPTESEEAQQPAIGQNPASGIGEDSWYPVDTPQRETAEAGNAFPTLSAPSGPEMQSNAALTTTQLAALSALLALIAAIAGAAWWFRKRGVQREGAPDLLPAPALAAGVRRSMPDAAPIPPPVERDRDRKMQARPPRTPAPEPLPAIAPEPSIPQSPAPIALQVDIVGATRSMMMLTVDFRLTIANRSPDALRDLAMSTQLVCARKADGDPQPDTDLPIQLVERIGPHQSRTISGKVLLPLSEITVMRQGSTPLFIPLLLVRLQGQDRFSALHRFVLGLPSANNAARLHPIPLDTTPGGIPGLRAQEIKQASMAQPA